MQLCQKYHYVPRFFIVSNVLCYIDLRNKLLVFLSNKSCVTWYNQFFYFTSTVLEINLTREFFSRMPQWEVHSWQAYYYLYFYFKGQTRREHRSRYARFFLDRYLYITNVCNWHFEQNFLFKIIMVKYTAVFVMSTSWFQLLQWCLHL